MSYCKYCGTKLADGTLFCIACGKPQTEAQAEPMQEAPAEEAVQAAQEPVMSEAEVTAAETFGQAEASIQEAEAAAPVIESEKVYYAPVPEYKPETPVYTTPQPAPTPKSQYRKGRAVTSLIFGILSFAIPCIALVLFFLQLLMHIDVGVFFGMIGGGALCGVLSIIFAVSSKKFTGYKFSGMAITGLIFSVLGLILTAVLLVLTVIFITVVYMTASLDSENIINQITMWIEEHVSVTLAQDVRNKLESLMEIILGVDWNFL